MTRKVWTVNIPMVYAMCGMCETMTVCYPVVSKPYCSDCLGIYTMNKGGMVQPRKAK